MELFTSAVVARGPMRSEPKVTENFLLGQEGVVDASVWWDGRYLQAYVTLLDSTIWSANALRAICMDNLGLHQTPQNIRLASLSDRNGAKSHLRAIAA